MCYDVDFWFFSVMSSLASFPEEDDEKETLKLEITVSVMNVMFAPSHNGIIFTSLKFSHSLDLLGLQTPSLLNSVTVEVSRLTSKRKINKII